MNATAKNRHIGGIVFAIWNSAGLSIFFGLRAARLLKPKIIASLGINFENTSWPSCSTFTTIGGSLYTSKCRLYQNS